MTSEEKTNAPDRQPVRVLYVTSEAAPFCKTGGLADVAGSLPPALAAAVSYTHLSAEQQ